MPHPAYTRASHSPPFVLSTTLNAIDDKAKDIIGGGSKRKRKRSRATKSVGSEDTRSFQERFGDKSNGSANAPIADDADSPQNPIDSLRSLALGLVEKTKPDKDEDPGVLLFKVLQKGTWGAIIILILWEAYINSPFFERAAPAIPVVF